ncbi:MAG: DUF2298 domain-containing protein [Candidatus Aenigmatarchaeota archaeon]
MFIWWLIIEIIGFITLPLSIFIFGNTNDKGYGVSKILGILLLCYFTWIISHILPYNLFTILISFSLIISIFLFLSEKVELKKFFKKNIKLITTTELIFTFSFIFFTLIRAQTPAAEGLEKLFDMSLINGILRTQKMPPLDPWYSGGNINYYYFGHFIVATLTKISLLPSYVTFNLSLGMLFSFISLGTFVVCYNLTGKTSFSIFGIFLLAFLGNMLGFLQILTILQPPLNNFFIKIFNIEYAMTCCHDPHGPFWDQLFSFPVWSSTRIIPNTINEFPYASFLFGEVHAHILSIPIQLLTINLFFEIFSNKNNKKYIIIKNNSIKFLIISFLLGCLYFTNSWEYPTYVGLFVFTLIFNCFKSVNKISHKRIINTLGIFIIVIIFSFILFLPYHINVRKSFNYGFVKERSNIFQIIIIFPVFIYIIFSYFIFNKKIKIDFPFILTFIGLIILIFCEIFYIDSRYNTVFKFYYHIWIFWSISSSYYLSKMWSNKSKIWKITLFFLILTCCTITIFSTLDRIKIGLNYGITLDGLKYMKDYHPSDYEIIIWTIKNIKGNPIILEAPGGAFTYSSIFSTYTGLQTIVGWDNHVAIHRGQWPTERVNDVNEIYTTNNISRMIELLEKYNVSYIFIGSVEKKKYSDSDFSIFDNFELVKSFGDNKIFKVG